jgi:hypothetical protein
LNQIFAGLDFNGEHCLADDRDTQLGIDQQAFLKQTRRQSNAIGRRLQHRPSDRRCVYTTNAAVRRPDVGFERLVDDPILILLKEGQRRRRVICDDGSGNGQADLLGDSKLKRLMVRLRIGRVGIDPRSVA